MAAVDQPGPVRGEGVQPGPACPRREGAGGAGAPGAGGVGRRCAPAPPVPGGGDRRRRGRGRRPGPAAGAGPCPRVGGREHPHGADVDAASRRARRRLGHDPPPRRPLRPERAGRSVVSGRPRCGALAAAGRCCGAGWAWVGWAPAGRVAAAGRGRSAGGGQGGRGRAAGGDPQRPGAGQRAGVGGGSTMDRGLGRRRAVERGRGGRGRRGELVQPRPCCLVAVPRWPTLATWVHASAV
jgi:hypothetical protein